MGSGEGEREKKREREREREKEGGREEERNETWVKHKRHCAKHFKMLWYDVVKKECKLRGQL